MLHPPYVEVSVQMSTKDLSWVYLSIGLHPSLEAQLPFLEWNGVHPFRKPISNRPSAPHMILHTSKWIHNKCET